MRQRHELKVIAANEELSMRLPRISTFDRDRRGRTWSIYYRLLAISLSALPYLQCLAQEPATDSRVILQDGVIVTGILEKKKQVVTITNEFQTVFLSPSIIQAIQAVPKEEPPPTYAMNAQRLQGLKRKGKLGLVHQHASYSPPDEHGEMTLSCEDFVLGKLSVTIVPVRITPFGVDYSGVEYEFTGSFNGGQNIPFACQLAKKQAGEDPAARLKLARFMRLAGSLWDAGSILEILHQSGIDEATLLSERTALAEAVMRRDVDNVLRLRAGHDLNAWRQEAAALSTRECPPPLHDEVTAIIAEAAAANKAVAQARALLSAAGIAPRADDQEAAVRLLRVLGADEGQPPTLLATLPATQVARLSEPWVEGLDRENVTEALLAEAITLADQTARCFASEDATAATELAANFAGSKLTLRAKLAILGKAQTYPDPGQDWTKISYRHPTSGKTYHYYVQVPPQYRSDCPCPTLISLHGQVTKADVMRNFWGSSASRWGMILISPEYIYDRESGYRESIEEHEAVLGALWDASKTLNIDHDRVALQGHSQGGHATWDIGTAHAGMFAGVVPLLGIPLKTPLANLADSALYSIDGSLDGGAPQANRRALEELARLGCDARYVEFTNRTHEAFFEEYDRICAWMLSHRRTARASLHLYPARTCDTARNWLRLTSSRLSEGLLSVPIADVHADATCKANTYTVTAQGARTLTILIDPRMINLDQPVIVKINGKIAIQRKVDIDWRFAIGEAMTRRDRQELFLQHLDLKIP